MKTGRFSRLLLALLLPGLFYLSGHLLLSDEGSAVDLLVSTFLPGGDFSGNGLDDTCIFLPPGGCWRIRSLTVVDFGRVGDWPTVGAYAGDGIDDLGVFRP